MSKNPNIVIIGGGTGSYMVASGLSNSKVYISMLMNMSDDGGSNRIIRDEFGLLPTSGIRQGVVALSKNKTILRRLFTYRFHRGGEGLLGMTFGNIFMAAMAEIIGSQKEAIKETCKLLQVEGQILPVSYDNVRLRATYEDGSRVVGEHQIDTHKRDSKIVNLETTPAANLDEEARVAIVNSDLIIIGPGDFYTNTVANLIVKGVPEALKRTKAKIMFISNLMDSPSETPGYALSDFFLDLKKYLPLDLIDYVLINNNSNFPKNALQAYKQENAHPVKDDLLKDHINPKVKIVRSDLLSEKVSRKVKGDILSRSIIRHDSVKLSKAILNLLKKL